MKVKTTFLTCLILCPMLLFLLPDTLSAQTFDAVKNRVKEKTLPNGMKFIVLERHEAPVVSFHVYADVGSVNETYGMTGISHLLEHMAFKGTKTVGIRNYDQEAKILADLDQVYDQLVREQNAVIPDPNKIKQLQESFDRLSKAAHDLVVIDEFGDMMSKEGAQGLNAFTNNDATQYVVSLPSNRLEFWMAMESERFMNPVFREFFKERDVVMEERRLRVETQPTGRLIEDFIAIAFKAHPYRHMVVGHMSDLQRITRKDVEAYFRRYYSPSNLTVAVVGDVNAGQVFRLADLYFSRIPGHPKPEPLRTAEPPQWGERHVTVQARAQPMLVVGYHRPDINSPEDLPFDAMANILGTGRSSRIYQSLVKEKKIAVQVGAFNGWPGNKYPNLFAVYAVPARDHTAAECLEAIEAEIEKLKTESVTPDELTKYQRRIKKWMIDRLKSNSRMAAVLTFNEVVRGDWQKSFDIIREVEAVGPPDVQAVARKYLLPTNRTVGEIVPQAQDTVVF